MTKPLNAFDRYPLINGPTPLQPMPGITAHCDFPVYIKRDDLTGVGAGGNKVRKLEFLLAEARRRGARAVVTGGGIQSNHAAMTAICARHAGLQCHLALVESVPIQSTHYDQGGNIVLEQLCGAHIRRYAAGLGTNACIAELAQEVHRDSGHAPYEICMGGSDAIGALGYVRAAVELGQQCDELGIQPATLIHASGSAGTQAGLIVGMALAGLSTRVIGMSVLYPETKLRALVLSLCDELAALLELEGIDWNSRIEINDAYIGSGYGIPSAATWQSIRTAIDKDAVVFDPVYSGKAFQGLLDQLATRRQSLGDSVVFLHTGGLAGLLAYADQVTAAPAQ